MLAEACTEPRSWVDYYGSSFPPARGNTTVARFFWAREADSPKWHLVSGAPEGLRIPCCSAPPWHKAAGEATLPLESGAVFGPVCNDCSVSAGVQGSACSLH